MTPSLQGTIQTSLTQTPHHSVQLETEMILPEGGMASDAPAESGEGSSAKSRLRHPGPTLASGRLQRTPLGPLQVQEAVTAVQGVLKPLMPRLGSLNIKALEHEITRRVWASAHGNLESNGSIVSLLLHTPLQAGGDEPEVNGAVRIPRKPGPNCMTSIEGEDLTRPQLDVKQRLHCRE
jgi:hypothetical protein